MEIIIGRYGEQAFPITDKSVSGKHIKLTTLPDGNVQVKDLGSSNGTFIDGLRISEKVVTRNTSIRLGSNYTFKICDVLPEVPKKTVKQQNADAPQPKKVPEYSIRHLEGVWNEYQDMLAWIKAQQQQKSKQRMLPMMLGSASGIFAIIPGNHVYIAVPIAVISFLIYIKMYNEKDTSPEDTKAAKNKLIKKYVCPNPECHRTLPLQDYSIISQNGCCPYCKCKWTK